MSNGSYLGDFYAGDVVRFFCNTKNTSSVPTTLTGGSVACYKDGSTTEDGAYPTISVDHDSVTGLHLITINTASDGTFYSAGSEFTVVFNAGTVGGTSVVGTVIGTFSLEARNIEADVVKVDGAESYAQNLGAACGSYSATRGLAGTALPAAAAGSTDGIPTMSTTVNGDGSSFADAIKRLFISRHGLGVSSLSAFTVADTFGAEVASAAILVRDPLEVDSTQIASYNGTSWSYDALSSNVGTLTLVLNITGRLSACTLTMTITDDFRNAKDVTLNLPAGVASGTYLISSLLQLTHDDGQFQAYSSPAAALYEDGVKLGNTVHGGAAATIQFARMIGISDVTDTPAVALTGAGVAAGLEVVGGAGGGPGVKATGSGAAPGFYALGGITGVGFKAASASGDPALTIDSDTVANIADKIWDEVLAQHLGAGSTGEALNKAAVGVAAATSSYTATGAVRTVGDDDGGTAANLLAHDDVYFATGEVAGSGFEVSVTLSSSNTSEVPSLVRVTAYYNGASNHEVGVYAYNYSLSALERVGTMRTRTQPFDYVFPVSNDHFDGSGAAQLVLKHELATYNPSHALYIDYVVWEKWATTNELATDIAYIRAQVDDMDNEMDIIFDNMVPEATIAALTEAIGRIIKDTLIVGTISNPYQVSGDAALVLYKDTDVDGMTFTVGPQWATYLAEDNVEIWFNVRTNHRATTNIINVQGTIEDANEGVLSLSLSQDDLDVDVGTFDWQLQLRRPIYAGDPPVLQSTQKRMLMEGKVYIKPTFKV